jgi:hypothetical protein
MTQFGIMEKQLCITKTADSNFYYIKVYSGLDNPRLFPVEVSEV